MSVNVVINEYPERENLSSKECRACLTFLASKIGSHNIFAKWKPDFISRTTTMAIEMEKLSHIQITHQEGYSQHICNVCHDRLCTALLLVADITEATEFFAKKKTKTTWPRPIEWNKDVNGEVLRPSQDIEIKKEIISDEEFDDDGGIEVPIMDIKIEPEEITGQGYLKARCNGSMSNSEHKKLSSPVADVESDHFSEFSEDYLKEEPMSDDEELLDMPLECMLCAKKFRTVSGLKAHVITRHDYMRVKRKLSTISSPMDSDLESHSPAKRKDIHTCTTCHRSFVTSTDLKVHETCHKHIMCYPCGAKFNEFQEIAKHVETCFAKQKPVQHKTLDDAIRERKRTEKMETHNNKIFDSDKIEDEAAHKKDNNETHIKEKQTENEEYETRASSDSDMRQHQKVTEEKIAKDKRTEEEKYNRIETELDSIFEFVQEIKVPKTVKDNVNNETLQETLEKTNEVDELKNASNSEESLPKEDNVRDKNNEREMEVEITMEELESGNSDQIMLEFNLETSKLVDSKDNVDTQDENSQHIAPIETTLPEENENSVLENSQHIAPIETTLPEENENSVLENSQHIAPIETTLPEENENSVLVDNLRNGSVNISDSNVIENKENSVNVNDEQSEIVKLIADSEKTDSTDVSESVPN